MLKSRFDYALLMVVVSLLGGAWIVYSREIPTTVDYSLLTEAPIVGHLAPSFSLNTPIGETVSLEDYVDRNGSSGRPVVINYWASWCAPCRIEMPHLQKASLTYANKVVFLGINQGESASTVTEFGLENGITYPLLVDAGNVVNRDYNISGLPTTVFVDAKGIVREVFVGILNEAVIESRINGLIGEG